MKTRDSGKYPEFPGKLVEFPGKPGKGGGIAG